MRYEKLAIDLKFFLAPNDFIENLKIFLSNFISLGCEVYILSDIPREKAKKLLDSINILLNKHYTNIISILEFVTKNKKTFKVVFRKNVNELELDYNEFKEGSFEVAEFLDVNTILFRDSTGIVSSYKL